METPLDWRRACREDLIAMIGRLREQVADRDQEIARLRAELVSQQAALVRLQERVGTVLVKASRVANNTSPTGQGGGIFNAGNLTLEATRVDFNRAAGSGGNGNARGARLTLNPGTVVTMNTATNPTPSGGGIYNIGTVIDTDTAPNVFGNNPDNCINEAPGTGCPA